MNDINFKQRCAIRFWFRLGQSATKTFAKLQQACGDSVLLKVQLFSGFKAFLDKRDPMKDKYHSVSSSTAGLDENVDKIRDLVRLDSRLPVKMIENIQMVVTDQLKAISVSEFQHCYEQWKKRLQRCVASQRELL